MKILRNTKVKFPESQKHAKKVREQEKLKKYEYYVQIF